VTPPINNDHNETVVRHLRSQPLRLDSLSVQVGKLGTAHAVRLVPGSAQVSYLLPALGVAVLVQPAIAVGHVLPWLQKVAQREDVRALVVVDNRLRLANQIPSELAGKPVRILFLAGARG